MRFCILFLSLLTGVSALGQRPPEPRLPQPQGFLCCNMRSDGKWISDINYTDSGQSVVPLGTPVKVTGYGRHRVFVLLDDKPQAIGNDYSRDIEPLAFARRYVVAKDPRLLLAGYPARVRAAIEAGHVQRGMTHQQVLMALGYPISSENPTLDAPRWRYWRSTFAEFQVFWGEDGRVKDLESDPLTKRLVFDE